MRRLIVAVLALPALVSAQVPDVLPGTRVRVRATAPMKQVTGTVMAQTPDTLDIAESGSVRVRVASVNVTRIEVSVGKTAGGGAARGLKVGAVIGAVVYGIIGILVAANASEYELTAAEVFPVFITAGAVGGAFWGTLVGAIVGAEGWRRVYEAPKQPGRIAFLGPSLALPSVA